MTSKEALRKILGFISFCCYEYFDKEVEKDWKKDIEIIKQDLDRLEVLENENKKWREIVGCDLCEALGREILLEENEKLKKAIEILKKYLYLIMDDSGFIINADSYLPKEEFDLLKEVLEL